MGLQGDNNRVGTYGVNETAEDLEAGGIYMGQQMTKELKEPSRESKRPRRDRHEESGDIWHQGKGVVEICDKDK